MSEEYLCLTDLLDQDVSACEYYQTLPPQARHVLEQSDICTFAQLQAAAAAWREQHPQN